MALGSGWLTVCLAESDDALRRPPESRILAEQHDEFRGLVPATLHNALKEKVQGWLIAPAGAKRDVPPEVCLRPATTGSLAPV